MSEACEIFAEVIVTTAKTLPPGGATMALMQGNATMCFYAPQTCAALPATLAAGGAIDAWASLLEYSPAFEELNKLAFTKGCRLVIVKGEVKDTWRVILVTVKDVGKAAKLVAEETKREIDKAQSNGRTWMSFLNTPDGVMWMMNRLGGM